MIVKPAVAAFLACSSPDPATRAGRCGLSPCFRAERGSAARVRPFLRSAGAGAALRFKVEGDLTPDAPEAIGEITDADRFANLLEITRGDSSSSESDGALTLETFPGGARGLSADRDASEGESLLRVPLERCVVEDLVVDDGEGSTIPMRLRGEESAGCRLAASLLLRLERVRRHPSQDTEGAVMSMWADLLPKQDEMRPSLPVHWPEVSPSTPAGRGIETEAAHADPTDISQEHNVAETTDPGPGYAILSQAVELYGRSTVDRALNVYKARSSAPEETGLPNERAVRTLLYDKMGCTRREVDAAVKNVVLNRGARRGGRDGRDAAREGGAPAFLPRYTALSRAIDLYGRGTVDRALALYGSRRGDDIEAGLPDEHAVRSFLIRRFGCDREQVETVINDVVRTRGARVGGSSIGIKTKAEEAPKVSGQGGKVMGCLALERAAAKARAQRAEDIRSVAEIIQDSGSLGFTEDAVDFALDLVKTRALRVTVPTETGEGRAAIALPPVYDFLNHGGQEANAHYEVECDDLVVRSSRPLSAGEEVLIDYGTSASPAWRCLLNYGFVPQGTVADVRDKAEIIVGEGDEAEAFRVGPNLVPVELIERLSSSSSAANDDSAIEFTPELGEKVFGLASTAVENLDKLDFESSFDETASSLLSELRDSQLRVLVALKDNILRFQKERWQGWRSNDKERFMGDEGKEEISFLVL